MTVEQWSAVAAVGAVGAVIMAGFALWGSFVISNKQTRLQTQIEDQEEDLDRRRFFVPLWEKMNTVKRINSSEPIGPQVRNANNVFSLVALSWEAGIVDKKMVVLAFRTTFEEVYEDIMQITQPIKEFNRTGPEIIRSSPEVTRLYDEIKKSRLDQSRMSK